MEPLLQTVPKDQFGLMVDPFIGRPKDPYTSQDHFASQDGFLGGVTSADNSNNFQDQVGLAERLMSI